jgi:GGDEF domain-containing protein
MGKSAETLTSDPDHFRRVTSRRPACYSIKSFRYSHDLFCEAAGNAVLQEAAHRLAARQKARVVTMDIDRYGRTVGRIYVNGVDVNAELARSSHA